MRLRRQIYGLEEADIIPGEKTKTKSDGQEATLGGLGTTTAGQGSGGKEDALISVGEGGMGKLDIGWLNSRSQSVDRNMEAELWARARNFLEGYEKTDENRTARDASSEAMEMETDMSNRTLS